MRGSFSGALEREFSQRRAMRYRTGEKCRPAEREEHLTVGVGEITVRECAFVLQPWALHESQLCNSMLAAEHPSSNRNQQPSPSSIAPEKRSGSAVLQRICRPWTNAFKLRQSSRLRNRPICQSPIRQSSIYQTMNVTSSWKRMIGLPKHVDGLYSAGVFCEKSCRDFYD
jgi:hypothetical protein